MLASNLHMHILAGTKRNRLRRTLIVMPMYEVLVSIYKQSISDPVSHESGKLMGSCRTSQEKEDCAVGNVCNERRQSAPTLNTTHRQITFNRDTMASRWGAGSTGAQPSS